ncbi:MAG: oxidoreductase [Acidobacteria bacterium]|nr:oxidoreductase [Acidobacteriota bacterium]
MGLTARLAGCRDLAPGVRHFDFDVEGVEQLAFTPGQFVSLTHDFDGREITRAYSIAAPPRGNRLELCLNLVEGGRFSTFLFGLRPGDTVHVANILGTFVWRQPSNSILVATGTGIAPMRAMLGELGLRGWDREVHLIFGARYERGLLYRAEFEALAAREARFRFTPTVTRPGAEWTGRVGRVQPLLLEALSGTELARPHVYVCGLREMVDDVRAHLKGLGIDRRQIIYEKYD